MNTNGLLFIPDISGFTQFVNKTEIEHSSYIITELLENIINSNQLGLSISEIEGDAVLFYRFGKPPSLEEMYRQVETMFCNFQKKIKSYEQRRACQCSACIAAKDLSLKVITHYGEFSTYNVKNYSKLIGKDVILAHQLLKNEISHHEYWLVTNRIFDAQPEQENLPKWFAWMKGNKQTDDGEVMFQYSMLSPLVALVEPEPLPELGLPADSIKLLCVERMIDAHPVTVLSILGQFSLRPKWFVGVKDIGQVSHPINHVGVKHSCNYKNKNIDFYSSYFNMEPEAFYYNETDSDRTFAFHYTVKRIKGDKTMLIIGYYTRNNPLAKISFNLFKKASLSRDLEASLVKLENLSKQADIGYEIQKD